MSRFRLLGLAALAGAVVVALTLAPSRRAPPATELASVAAAPEDAPTPPIVEIGSDELTPPAPDPPRGEASDGAGSPARVSMPDPLEPVVQYLRASNPAFYGSLTLAQASALTMVDLGPEAIGSDVTRLLDLPGLATVRVHVKSLMHSETERNLVPLRRKGVSIIGHYDPTK